jgi:hypothetical protein
VDSNISKKNLRLCLHKRTTKQDDKKHTKRILLARSRADGFSWCYNCICMFHGQWHVQKVEAYGASFRSRPECKSAARHPTRWVTRQAEGVQFFFLPLTFLRRTSFSKSESWAYPFQEHPPSSFPLHATRTMASWQLVVKRRKVYGLVGTSSIQARADDVLTRGERGGGGNPFSNLVAARPARLTAIIS